MKPISTKDATELEKKILFLINHKKKTFYRSNKIPSEMYSYWESGSKTDYFLFNKNGEFLKKLGTNHPYFEKDKPKNFPEFDNEKHTIVSKSIFQGKPGMCVIYAT